MYVDTDGKVVTLAPARPVPTTENGGLAGAGLDTIRRNHPPISFTEKRMEAARLAPPVNPREEGLAFDIGHGLQS